MVAVGIRICSFNLQENRIQSTGFHKAGRGFFELWVTWVATRTYVRLFQAIAQSILMAFVSGSALKKPIEVAVVEDDPEIRDHLEHRIGNNPAFRLVRSYPDAESALSDLPRHRPDVVLMDINLPVTD